MKIDLRPNLAVLLLAALALSTLGGSAAAQVPVPPSLPPWAQLPPGLPPSSVPPVVGMTITTTLDAPPAVVSGSGFKAMVEARLTSIGATIIQLVPVDDDADSCGITSVEATSGLDMGNNQYALYNVPGTFSPAQEELQMHTLAPFVRLAIGYTTKENVQHFCNAHVKVLQPLEVGALPFDLTKEVKLQLPGVPVEMGALHSSSNWDIQDHAFVEKYASVQNVTFYCLPAACSIALTGVASHTDGGDLGDYGRFWYTGPNVPDNGMSIADDTVAQAFAVATVPLHELEKWVESYYCFIGYLVDGGAGDTWEQPHAESCVRVYTYEPAVDPQLYAEICPLYFHYSVQTQFLQGQPTAFIEPKLGKFTGSSLGINAAFWQPICDKAGNAGERVQEQVRHGLEEIGSPVFEDPGGPVFGEPIEPIGPIEPIPVEPPIDPNDYLPECPPVGTCE